MNTVYDFEALQINGKAVPLLKFKGKVMLIVNTASACGFTPQFAGLEELHLSYAKQGLVVLGFPCNQFGAQDPGSNETIAEFCQLNYGVSFPMMAKIDVNGPHAHPLYQWLAGRRGPRPAGQQGHQMELHQVFGRQGRHRFEALRAHRYAGQHDTRH